MSELDRISSARTVQMVISLTIFVINIFGNSLILLVVKYSKYFSNVSRHLVAHVAAADIWYGCSVVVRTLFNSGQLEWTTDSCAITTTLVFGCSACSGCGICLILVENYLSVRHLASPGGIHMTLCKARICIVSFWTIVIVVIIVPAYVIPQPDLHLHNSCTARPSFFFTQLIVILFILTTMLLLMTHMMLIVRRNLRNLFGGDASATDLFKQRSMKKNAKLATLFTVIAAGFIVSWAPVIIGIALKILCPPCISSSTLLILASFVQLNSCINCGVYIMKDKSFKRVCLQVLKCEPNQVAPSSIACS